MMCLVGPWNLGLTHIRILNTHCGDFTISPREEFTNYQLGDQSWR